MLTQLQIRDFAIVESLDLELEAGMTVLTGETGAGKSILVGAVGLVLGDRADADAVRHGAERAEVSAGFDLATNPAAQAWLCAQELDADEECVLRRTLSREGRSRAYVNGRPVPLQALKAVGTLLVDIHGQHEHQSLLRPEVQRHWLDACGGHLELAREVERAWRRWKGLEREHAALLADASDGAARTELLTYQLRELEALGLTEDELPLLEEEHRRLANAERLIGTAQETLAALYEDDERSVAAVLGGALAAVQGLQELDPRLAGIGEYLENARIQVDEAADELRTYLDRLDLDPERLRRIEERLSTIHDLARKHRVAPAELPARRLALEEELHALTQVDVRRTDLESVRAAAHRAFEDAAGQLGTRRKRAAARLSRRITEAMQDLGMPGGRFEVGLRTATEGGPGGHEGVEFLVSANPGQPPRPLRKVASGGELSRISLAVQITSLGEEALPSLIFDEVDSGIGGAVAETVGRHLRSLGGRHQVLCVTHLPQVASLAHHHLQVDKHTRRGTTRTRIRVLDPGERVGEVARMLGGLEITPQTLAHAEEMVQRGRG
ncbi:DNA repair protein RecN [bacterium BMS3Bbin12]|nr:DNA repair protein RecN [bacterium BMS3Bbin12]GBE49300.1 DNA repair protein RecN [bacterium BMS3Bbin13]HDK02292.1 DNA repair protein RecN [Gammaproteobacteria bacterium]